MFIASVCLSVCLKPKFDRLKTKFDDDAEGSAAPRSTPPILIRVREKANFLPAKFRNTLLSKITMRTSVHELPRRVHAAPV